RCWDFDSFIVKKKSKEKFKSFAINDMISEGGGTVRSDSDKLSIKTDSKNIPVSIYSKISFIFECLMYLFYNMSTYKQIEALTVFVSENYSKEIMSFLKEMDIGLLNFHFLDFLISSYKTLKSASIEFNCLDSECFEKILVLLNSNEQLEDLNISLFTFKENYFPTNLFRLTQHSQKEKSTSNFLNEDFSDFDKIVINKLLKNFEENIRSLFFLFQQKKDLKSLSIFCDSPDIVTSNENYTMILIKLFCNFLFYLNSKEYPTEKIKLIFPYLVLDTYRIPSINDILEDINLEENNKTLKELYIQCGLFNITNLDHLLTKRLKKLSICQLNEVSFSYLCNFISKAEFASESQLEELTIGLSYSIIEFKEIKKDFELIGKAPFTKMDILRFITGLDITGEEYDEFKTYFKDTKYRTIIEVIEECRTNLKRDRKGTEEDRISFMSNRIK
ncbi:MAG: hypothetical protein MJ252_24305, partial [archaeon]|nr:hypothetical protein [archaeon]